MSSMIFDSRALIMHLQRAVRSGYADFLFERITDDLLERLAPVMRSYDKAIDIASPVSQAAAFLEHSLKIGSVDRLSIIKEDNAFEIADENTPLPDNMGNYDLAFSLLALHAVNDLPGALIRICRLLKPDGLFIGCLFGNETLTELRQSFLLAEADEESGMGISPHIAPFADIRNLGDLLQRAGFTLPVSDHERITIRYADPFALMADLRAMGMTNALTDRAKKPLRRKTLFKMADIYQSRFADADGKIRATFDLIWLLGWAPDDSQPKPLQPGQYSVRFEDAIKHVNRKNAKDDPDRK